MIRVLIVDDENLERRGIKILLKRENEEMEIIEAENGTEALGFMMEKQVDIMFSDIKMPRMNGLELVKRARELYPNMEIVIFSGYNDFTYAKDALRYGVVDYVLKPVEPQEFHETFQRVMRKINNRIADEQKQSQSEDYLKRYFLMNYLYTGNEEEYRKLMEISGDSFAKENEYSRMILAGSSNHFFETEEDQFVAILKEQLGREFFYMNLNSNESLFIFREKYTDYEMLAGQLYQFFRQQYTTECYFAVSDEINDMKELYKKFQSLEEMLEEQFYQPEQHIFMKDKDQNSIETGEPEDAKILENISQDIRYKDMVHLWQDFGKLKEKYGAAKQFSQMYVKFVFSSILKESFESMPLADEKELSKRVDRLYRCKSIDRVLEVTEQSLRDLEEYLKEETEEFRKEIAQVKNYIFHNYEKNLSVEQLAGQIYLSSGYLSLIFKQETGMNLNRFIRKVRMDKAKELLENTNKKITQVAKEVGFTNTSYFCRSFREFFGETPESCRRRKENDQETISEV